MNEDSTRMELIRNANNRITELSSQLNQLGRELSANQQSTTGLWHEVGQMKRKVDKIRDDFVLLIGDHEDDCIAHKKAVAKALADPRTDIEREDPSSMFQLPPVQQSTPARPVVEIGDNIKIPRLAILIALLLGALLVGGGIVLGAAWSGGAEGAGKAIRGISGEVNKESGKQ